MMESASPKRSLRFWLVTLAALVAVSVTASLGVWQLGRAQQKTDLQARIDAQWNAAPIANAALFQSADMQGLHYTPASVTGQWVPEHTIYLDNRTMNGRPGYLVVTPLTLAGKDATLMVQRGWIPRDFQDRKRLPDLPLPEGDVTVSGRLSPPPSHYFELGESEEGPIRQNIDLGAFSRETGLALFTQLSLQQTGDEASALKRDWPRFEADVHKHYGYAAQWFGLCALVAFLYVWFQFIQPRRQRRPHGHD
ncbi:SURF1 family protein [Hydrogenophaga sp. 5NK40-0174]|uniref:SURF1 family protein n=1 Tax=Hydrogenophaga sp. 5NK40-0174 TaxID=3127649 RepID=UPI00310262EA